MLKILKDPV